MNTIIYVSTTYYNIGYMFRPTLGHPQACGRQSHWCCLCIGIQICL